MEGKITGVLYAVIRVGEKRFKTLKDIKGFKAHMEREKETTNAIPELKHLNRQLIGDSDIYKTMRERLEGCTLVKDANIGHEIILTASREYFLNISEPQKEMWIDKNIKFLKDKYGDACIYAQLHADETTIHIHAIISNKTLNRWNKPTINNSVYFGGRNFKGVDKLRTLQDEYSGAMSEFNLSRGIRYSNATHIQIKQYYALINDNMSLDKLNRTIETAYKYNFIKEQYSAVAGRIRDYMRAENEPINNIDEVIKEVYILSSLTTAPDKFYSEEKEYSQRLKVKELLKDYDIPEPIADELEELKRETHKRRKETSLEAYTRMVAETRIKREVIELKNTLKKMTSGIKDMEKLEKRVKDLQRDKDIYKTVIRTLSEYYYIPQQAVERIIKSAVNNREPVNERKLEK